MDYGSWIEREQRYRVKILADWPETRDAGIYRVCQACGEVCICMETSCPNCDSPRIDKQKLDLTQVCLVERMRCRLRYERISAQSQ